MAAATERSTSMLVRQRAAGGIDGSCAPRGSERGGVATVDASHGAERGAHPERGANVDAALRREGERKGERHATPGHEAGSLGDESKTRKCA